LAWIGGSFTITQPPGLKHKKNRIRRETYARLFRLARLNEYGFGLGPILNIAQIIRFVNQKTGHITVTLHELAFMRGLPSLGKHLFQIYVQIGENTNSYRRISFKGIG